MKGRVCSSCHVHTEERIESTPAQLFEHSSSVEKRIDRPWTQLDGSVVVLQSFLQFALPRSCIATVAPSSAHYVRAPWCLYIAVLIDYTCPVAHRVARQCSTVQH
jgi:hypothetical protein